MSRRGLVKSIALAATMTMAWGAQADGLQIRNVTAKQRYPWNGLVDVACTVSGIVGTTNGLELAVAAVMPDSGTARKVSHFWVVKNGTNSTDYAVHTNGDYRLVWDAQADLGQVRYSNMVVRVTVVKGHGKVQLWAGGPYWAETNVGAEEPWEYGYYFWWGDVVGYRRENDVWVASDGSSSGFSFSAANTPTYGKNDSTLRSEGWITSDGVLAPEHDAAQVQWGGGWRMPTRQELNDLNSRCDWTWTTTNGVSGYVVRGRDGYASASIFLPAVGLGLGTSLSDAGSGGYYWSSVPYSDIYDSWCLGFFSDDHDTNYGCFRIYGSSVRPVQGFSEIIVTVEPKDDSAPFLLDTMPDPIPEIGGDGDVAGALAGSADGRLGKHVKTAAEYDAYRGWADANGLDHGTVKESPRAWFSYALDASNLVERAFRDGDVAIVSLKTASDGTFMFEVDVDGVLIGSSATAANLATVFEVQGSPSLSEDAFSPAKVRAALGVSADGRLLVTAMPTAAHATFFVRVRMHADDDGWTGDVHGKVQLWAGGPYWATTNVGADEPWEYGYYFWWGDIVGYRRENDAWVASDGSSSGFSFTPSNTPTYGKNDSTLRSEGWITADGVLAPEHDAAHVQWGGRWRMPTSQELSDLCNNCDRTWTTTNGVNGYVVRGRGAYASASIFLPAAGFGGGTSLYSSGSSGFCWSSVPGSDTYDSWYLGYHGTNYYGRIYGQSVRPVQGFTE